MKSKPTISTLEEERNRHLFSLRLVADREAARDRDAQDTHDAPLPPTLIETIALTPEDADGQSDAASLVTWITGVSEDARRMLVESDIHILKSLGESNDTEYDRPFGFKETVLPIREGDTVVGALWSGKYRAASLSSSSINAIAKTLDVKPAEFSKRLEAIPVSHTHALQAQRALLEQVRDSLEWALALQERHRESAAQLLESERVRSLGTLSGGIAHHFNNLLSVILGYSSFLLNRMELSGEADKALRQISEAAQKGRRLTEEILAFAGSDVEQETPCSVHEIMQSVLSLLETQTAGRVRISKALEADKDTVRAPRSVLHQTLFNLLTNAMDSMPEGGDLAVRTDNTPLTIGGEDVPHVRIEVVDSGGTGDGTSQRDRRARRSKLSRLYGMVDQLDGTATVTSDAGLSNRAEVLLPLDRTVHDVPQPRKVKKRLAPSLIWIVDDDPIFCEMCDRVLSDDGHEVRVISSGSDLRKAWSEAKTPPSLFIIDFSMPEYNGLELCTWLREKGSKAPVILVSGFSHTQPDIHKALKMRKTYFLQKPFPVPELADIVTVALGETLLGN